MKESVGFTVSLNIMIVFITIIVAFLCAALIYFKSNKVSNVITSAIEKYEGYNVSAIDEISRNLSSLGYGSHSITCASSVTDTGAHSCTLVVKVEGRGKSGYCVYACYEENNFKDVGGEKKYNGEYYYYKIRTNMMLTVPIIQDVLDIPIYSNTNRLYNFSKDDF